ncbi:hypothetical protein HNY73_002539 [Argiope bruennichi]|uniref:Uncharacterized protein n=1 Tax=Argiope bruennichi TaxID=94029 RepID=A0A8T0FWK2_ARGBR|nr:hypothetical protein HNY73_002539 [Argiope bruennichi]
MSYVTQNNSTTSPFHSTCKNSISIGSLLGVIACVLVFSLLIGLVVYHFKLCDRGYERVKKLSGTKLQPPLELDKKKRYRSEIIVTDDTNYDNMA